jgi:hypothetical protein
VLPKSKEFNSTNLQVELLRSAQHDFQTNYRSQQLTSFDEYSGAKLLRIIFRLSENAFSTCTNKTHGKQSQWLQAGHMDGKACEQNYAELPEAAGAAAAPPSPADSGCQVLYMCNCRCSYSVECQAAQLGCHLLEQFEAIMAECPAPPFLSPAPSCLVTCSFTNPPPAPLNFLHSTYPNKFSYPPPNLCATQQRRDSANTDYLRDDTVLAFKLLHRH